MLELNLFFCISPLTKALNRLSVYVIFIIFIGMPSANSQTCADIFTNSTKRTATLSQQLIQDPASRLSLFERKEASNSLDFLVPEYLPTVEHMKKELALISSRMQKVKGHYIGKALLLTATKLFKDDIANTEKKLTYAAAIRLAFQFAWLMRTATKIEGLLTAKFAYYYSPTIYSWRENRNYIKNILRISQQSNFLFLPTFDTLDIPQINRLWANRILPIGLTANAIGYDGKFSDPNSFAVHDAAHAMTLIRRVYNGNIYNLNNMGQITKYPYGKNTSSRIKGLSLIHAQMDVMQRTQNSLYEELDKYKLYDFIEFGGQITTRMEIELILFDLHHEGNFIPFNLNFETIEYGVEQLKSLPTNRTEKNIYAHIDSYYSQAVQESKDSGNPIDPSMMFYKKHTSDESKTTAINWIIYHWRNSGIHPIE